MVIFILTIIAVILFAFFRDTNKELTKVQLDGGIEKKYDVLIYSFLQNGYSVETVTRSSVILTIRQPGMSSSIVISPIFDNTLVQLTMNGIIEGVPVKMHWEFPKTINQIQMLNKISDDMVHKMDQLDNGNF